MSKGTIYDKSVLLHEWLMGKLEVCPSTQVATRRGLSLLYTPGVAEPCRRIVKNKDDVYKYTWKKNAILVVTDGTAVLGLGNIGPEAALPVMEGKAMLFKEFGGVNAVPMCLDTTDPDEIIQAVKWMAPAYGGVNLEDIKAPECVYIERNLQDLGIPVFHDDQHGTAIVVTAALINAAKVVKKEISDLTVVMSGAGAAGSAIIKMLHNLGVKEIYAFWKEGIINATKADEYDFLNKELSEITNSTHEDLSMEEAMTRADVFIGVSVPNRVTPEMVASMKKDPIVFAMANPEPEISYEAGKAAGAKVMATGRSDYPNQVNNLLAFPGVFKGTLECGATRVTEEMKLAAAYALAGLIKESKLNEKNIIVSVLNPKAVPAVAKAVSEKAREQGITRF